MCKRPATVVAVSSATSILADETHVAMARDEVGDAVESGGEMDSYEFYDQVEELCTYLLYVA